MGSPPFLELFRQLLDGFSHDLTIPLACARIPLAAGHTMDHFMGLEG
jgi:hypothetical protein